MSRKNRILKRKIKRKTREARGYLSVGDSTGMLEHWNKACTNLYNKTMHEVDSLKRQLNKQS